MGSLDVQVFMDVEMRHRVRTSTSRTTESRIPGVSGCQVGADTRRTRSTSLDTQVFLDTTMGWQIEAGTSTTTASSLSYSKTPRCFRTRRWDSVLRQVHRGLGPLAQMPKCFRIPRPDVELRKLTSVLAEAGTGTLKTETTSLDAQVLLVADVDIVFGLVDVQVRDDDGADSVGPSCSLHTARHQDTGRPRLKIATLLADLHGVVDAEVNILQPLSTACSCSIHHHPLHHPCQHHQHQHHHHNKTTITIIQKTNKKRRSKSTTVSPLLYYHHIPHDYCLC